VRERLVECADARRTVDDACDLHDRCSRDDSTDDNDLDLAAHDRDE
jgi:hypothetical protein